ncbi:VWA domain-containing protein [Roseovarius aestuariivivens]|uniref:VWA domain-containing protein n=1 Tax=Roseovarius aestuariivivens TaxID=1888910 RepID=UPI001080CE76|nr:VWA domain-containing protein [Roseovarius aestuariivivens]
MFKHITKATAIASIMALSAVGANAATFDLAFLMDESGSVASSDYTAAMDSLADALEASLANNPDTYNVKVISFSSGAAVVASASIGPNSSSADIKTALGDDIRDDAYSSGNTCYSCAFGLLGSSTGSAGIINMMTDGEPTSGTTSLSGLQTILNGVRGDGWDSLSFEAVENFGGAPNSNFLSELAFDTAGTGLQPIIQDENLITNPLSNAFVLEVSGFGSAYDQAISKKVQRIANPIPLPAGLPLVLTGLGFFGALRLRKQKRAA